MHMLQSLFCLTTSLHVSGVTITHLQEHKTTVTTAYATYNTLNTLNPELNPICYLLALLAHHFLPVSRTRVKLLTLRLLMSYIYIYIYIWSAYF